MTGGMTPWDEMLRTAARLGVGPEGFWRLSLREWRMLTARAGGVASLRDHPPPRGRERS